MSLKIIRGRAGSGKTTYMLNDMQESSGAIYIVPEQYSFSAEKKLVEKFGVSGLGNPQVLSFARLAEIIFSKYGSVRFIADNASYEMLVSYCANSISSENFRLFDGLVKKSELKDAASSLITTFKRYSVSVQALENAAKEVDDVLLSKKLSDSAVIYREYNKKLREAGIHDFQDKLSVLSNMLADDSCDFFHSRTVYIDQFTDFDPCELELIKMIMKRADRVLVALCLDEGAPFNTVLRTYKSLMRAAKEAGIKIEPEEITGRCLAPPLLRHIEAQFFAPDPISLSGTDGSVSVHCSETRISQIHYVAREICRAVRENNLRYRDISVVARDIESCKSLIDRIFPFYDIPVFIDRKIALSAHCVTAFITAVLDIMLGGFQYESVFTYAKSPFSPICIQDADKLESYCLAAGIRPSSWKRPFCHTPGAYKKENDMRRNTWDLDYINALRESIASPLEKLSKELDKALCAKDFVQSLFDFFESINLESKIKTRALALEEAGENLSAMQTMQVYNLLVDIFSDICNILGEAPLSLREFYLTVRAGLDSVEIGTIPVSVDCVTVGSIDRIKGHGAKHVFLIDVNSSVFPAEQKSQGLFSDDDKRILSKFGIELPPAAFEKMQSEELLVYDALTCATHTLTLCYPLSDSGSNALMPSSIITTVMQILPDISFTSDITDEKDTLDMISTKKATFDLLIPHLREYLLYGKKLSAELCGAAHYFMNDDEFAPLMKNAIKMIYYKNDTAVIDKELMEKFISDNMKTSVSKLETYNKCPFSFFAKYLLKLEPRQTYEINVSDSGSFLHDFLEDFSDFIASQKGTDGSTLSWGTIDDEFIEMYTPQILSRVLAGVNESMLQVPRIKALFERLKRTAVQCVYTVRRHIKNSDFIPLGYEISFDDDGMFKPITIKLEDGKKVTLRGRIDRADVLNLTMPDSTTGKFARIVDYKSGDKHLVLSDVYNGLQLQLFVYLSNICENGYSPAGILYCNLSDPIIKVDSSLSDGEISALREANRKMNGIVLSENDMTLHMGGEQIIATGVKNKNKDRLSTKDFNRMFCHIRRVVKNTAEKIYSGSFPISCTENACAWCEFSSMCSYDSAFSGCSVREIPKYKDEDILLMLEEEYPDELD
ncbi:MAG: PD-(D/E)XK nuclease family protein [Clostridia bacterium]|nr:PD-(D/E)XK nuclease family protein [Clostridia bacterium]